MGKNDIGSIQMNVENVVLRYIDDITCDICLDLVKDDAVGVSCCDSVFHGKCLSTNMEYNCVCPRCEEMFNVNTENPLLTRLLRASTNHSDVNEIYSAIFSKNPEDLKIIDKAIRECITKVAYHDKFRGYFPYKNFSKEFDTGKAELEWNDFTYGLLDGYNWENTMAVGRAPWSIARGMPVDGGEHVYLVIYSCDYRKVRQQLMHLFDVVSHNYRGQEQGKDDDFGFYIDDGLLVINLRGIVRKICVHVEYNNDPFWVVYVPVSHFHTYGTLYRPGDFYMTIKAMTATALMATKAVKAMKPLDSMEYVMGYDETVEHFSHRIGCAVQPMNCIEYIYPNFRFRIACRYGIDDIKKSVIGKISSDIGSLLDIEHCIDLDATSDISMELVSETESVAIPCSIMTARTIRKNVTKIIYKQPLSIKCT